VHGVDAGTQFADRLVDVVGALHDPIARGSGAQAGRNTDQVHAGRQQPVDDLVVHVTGHPIAVLDEVEALTIGECPVELQGDGRVGGEPRCHIDVDGAERRAVVLVADQQRAQDLVTGP